MGDKNGAKLKRHRLRRAMEQADDDDGGTIELCKPSTDQPVLRRYVPLAGLNADAEFRKLGILDWRAGDDLGTRVRIDDVTNRIICADSRQALARLPDESVTCIVTSPPYWNVVDYGFEGQLGPGHYEQYLDGLLPVWRECERVLAPNGKLCINTPIMPIPKAVIPDQHTRHIKNLNNDIEATILGNLSLARYSLYIWQKQTTEKMFGSYPHPPNIYEQNTVEFINVFVKPGAPEKLPAWIKEHSRLSQEEWMNLTRQVWRLYPEDVKRSRHPAPFPQTLPNRLIAMYTFAACNQAEEQFPGHVVLDPFCGTGATCVAARKLGRRYIGIDLGVDFVTAAARRCEEARRDGTIHLCPPHHTADRDQGEHE